MTVHARKILMKTTAIVITLFYILKSIQLHILKVRLKIKKDRKYRIDKQRSNHSRHQSGHMTKNATIDAVTRFI